LSLVIGKDRTNDKIVSVHYGKHQFAISSQLTIYFSTSLHLTETTPLDPVPSLSPADHLVLRRRNRTLSIPANKTFRLRHLSQYDAADLCHRFLSTPGMIDAGKMPGSL